MVVMVVIVVVVVVMMKMKMMMITMMMMMMMMTMTTMLLAVIKDDVHQLQRYRLAYITIRFAGDVRVTQFTWSDATATLQVHPRGRCLVVQAL